MCVFYRMNWSSGLLVYLPSVYSPVRIYLFGITFHNQPSTHSLLSPAYIFIPRFLEEHAEAVEGHRLLDGTFDDEFVADLGGGHERAVSLGGDVEIDGEELFLVLLRPEILVMVLDSPDVFEVKPVLEASAELSSTFCDDRTIFRICRSSIPKIFSKNT